MFVYLLDQMTATTITMRINTVTANTAATPVTVQTSWQFAGAVVSSAGAVVSLGGTV